MSFINNIPSSETTDKELLSAFKESGDMNHLSSLYMRYIDQVFGVCLKYLRDAQRSKDAVMDIFEELNKKLRSHEIDNFRGWLYVLARNYCLMQLRTPKNLKTIEYNPSFMQSGEISHLNSERLEKEETFNKLEECLKILPLEQKQAVELFYLGNKCYNEIAEITGYEWNKVRSFIQNGRRNLKICMDKKEGI